MEQTAFFGLIGVSLVLTLVMWVRVFDPRLLIIPAIGWSLSTFGATNYEIREACCAHSYSMWGYAFFLFVIAAAVWLYWLGAMMGKLDDTNSNNVNN